MGLPDRVSECCLFSLHRKITKTEAKIITHPPKVPNVEIIMNDWQVLACAAAVSLKFGTSINRTVIILPK